MQRLEFKTKLLHKTTTSQKSSYIQHNPKPLAHSHGFMEYKKDIGEKKAYVVSVQKSSCFN